MHPLLRGFLLAVALPATSLAQDSAQPPHPLPPAPPPRPPAGVPSPGSSPSRPGVSPADGTVPAPGGVLAADFDRPPTLDSVQTWFYPRGKVGRRARVTFQAVVDTTGRVDPKTIKLLTSTDHSFDLPARLTLIVTYYHPGQIGGRSARVLVQQGFTYGPKTPHGCEIDSSTTGRGHQC